MALALTPGVPPLVHVSIQPRGGYMSRIVFLPQARFSHPSGTPCAGKRSSYLITLGRLPLWCWHLTRWKPRLPDAAGVKASLFAGCPCGAVT